MKKLRLAPAGAIVAALLAGTTGYCTITAGNAPPPATSVPQHPPLRLLPEAILPYQPEDKG